MRQLGDLLATIPIPQAGRAPATVSPPSAAHQPLNAEAVDLVTDLAAGLPAGHVHLWGGPVGAGKTSFLLTLLCGAAQCQRRVLYATYDLPASSLAHRLLGMTAGVAPDRLPDPGGSYEGSDLSADEWDRVRASRRYLSSLPFTFLESRGFTTDSIRDRLARMPFRADVLAVDYLQAVVRERGTNVHDAVAQLTDLAHGMHVAVLCALRPDEGVRNREVAARGFAKTTNVPDRVGWIEPSGEKDRRADVVMNRHGAQTSKVLRVRAWGALEPK